MTIDHHPGDDTLMEYAAGTLKPALAALIACHLSLCPRCREEVRRMERIGGALLWRMTGKDLSGKGLERALSPLDRAGEASRADGRMDGQADAVLPPPLARYLGSGIDGLAWRKLAPGVEQVKIDMPRRGGDLRLLRVQPGLKLLRHSHYGRELTLVFKGAYADETGEYHAGDVADLDEEIEHRPRAIGEEECICLVAGETYPRYTRLSVRLLRPFLGL